ncbi:PA14 domain-containing protein [Streptomyces sp. NPDC051664]|uniref:PA14 domain-containing protein n=1 Tax=Streptomyces sp. NPDC051664 TaxID=3365668 RepID=UPI00379C2ED8
MNRPRRTTAATAGAVVLATSGGLLAAAGPASAAVTCASPVFKRTFYANTTFSGTPKATDCDSVINQNWGTGAPGFKGMPANNFGVRWSTTRDFGSGGPFTFTASSRDGIRVYLDGVRKVDMWKNVATTVSKTVNVTIPSGKHSLRVDFVNWTGAANAKFAYAPRTSATVDKVKPLVPTGTTVTYSTASTSTKVSWAKNKEMDLAGYRVYRRLKGTSYPAKPIATTTSTSYTDTTVPKDGNVYYYEVRAYDKAGNASSGTADLGITTVDRTAPAAPKGVEENWADGQWTYTPVQDPWTLQPREITATTFHDAVPADGQQARYGVVAVDQYGNQLTPDTGASVAAVTELDLRPTAPPATGAPLTYLSTSLGGRISWGGTGDRNENGSRVSGVAVHRWNPETGTFDLIGVDDSNAGYWWDSTQPTGTTVYYRVTVRYEDGTESGASQTAAATD